MDLLAALLVGQPLHILVVALVFLIAYGALRIAGPAGRRRPTRPLLIAAVGWMASAAWEWLVLVRTPEADIRVDLLLIWPMLAVLSAWGLLRLIR